MDERSAQDALATRDCGWPGCPSDAEHSDGLCERHHRLQTTGSTLPPPARCDECNALLTRAHSEACSRFVDTRRPATPPTNGAVMPSEVMCRMPDCPYPAAEETIGARKQGGRYDLCDAHLEALAQRARDTRKTNREAREREQEMRASELRAMGEAGRVPGRDYPADPKDEPGNDPTPEIREPGPLEPETSRPHDYYCILDSDHEGPCRDSDGRDWQERQAALEGGVSIAGTSQGELATTPNGCLAGCIVDDHDRSDGSPCVLRGSVGGLIVTGEATEPDRSAHAPGCMLDTDHDGECYVPGEPNGTPAKWLEHGAELVTLNAELTPAQRIMQAWAAALDEVYCAIGEEARTSESRHTLASLIERAGDLLAQGPLVASAVAALPSAE